jgi:NAD(P)-dependent dehydrogenase (short-subunit alcohol dehydrogenase family)
LATAHTDKPWLFSSDYEVETQIQTNLYGPLYTIQGVLPGMRARRSGTIVNVSSVAGQDGKPACGMYAASKFALEGLSETLALEVKEFGISVLIVEPGAFRTNFLVSMNLNDKGVPEPYAGGVADKALEMFKAYNGRQPGDAAKGVERMFEVVAGEGMAGKLTGKVRRMVIGEDAYTRIMNKNDDVRRDMETGKEVAFSTKVDE